MFGKNLNRNPNPNMDPNEQVRMTKTLMQL